jgi:hypothetical protein
MDSRESSNLERTAFLAGLAGSDEPFWLDQRQLDRVLHVKKTANKALKTVYAFQALQLQMAPLVASRSSLTKALGSGWIWPTIIHQGIPTAASDSSKGTAPGGVARLSPQLVLCAKISRMTSDHTPLDLALAIYYCLESTLRNHPELGDANQNGVVVAINMEEAGMQIIDKLLMRQALPSLHNIFAEGKYPIRVSKIFVYNTSTMARFAVMAAKRYLPAKLRERLEIVPCPANPAEEPLRSLVDEQGFVNWWSEFTALSSQVESQRRRSEAEEANRRQAVPLAKDGIPLSHPSPPADLQDSNVFRSGSKRKQWSPLPCFVFNPQECLSPLPSLLFPEGQSPLPALTPFRAPSLTSSRSPSGIHADTDSSLPPNFHTPGNLSKGPTIPETSRGFGLRTLDPNSPIPRCPAPALEAAEHPLCHAYPYTSHVMNLTDSPDDSEAIDRAAFKKLLLANIKSEGQREVTPEDFPDRYARHKEFEKTLKEKYSGLLLGAVSSRAHSKRRPSPLADGNTAEDSASPLIKGFMGIEGKPDNSSSLQRHRDRIEALERELKAEEAALLEEASIQPATSVAQSIDF